MTSTLKIVAASTALALPLQLAFAQEVPRAGGLIQQIPVVPATPRAAPELNVAPTPAAPAVPEDQTRFTVQALRVQGATVYPEAELLAASGFKANADVTISDLREFAVRIAEFYRRNGYFLAQAYLPPQEMRDGVATIEVVEGRYGKVRLRNQSNLSDTLAQDIIAGLKAGATIDAKSLERRLLMLSDVPGVSVRSTLSPGDEVGTSDLTLDITPGARFSGSVDADNAGNRYTGSNRLGTTLNVNNALGRADQLTLRALSSFNGLNYGRLSYQMQVSSVRVGGAYTSMKYWLGDTFAPLGSTGTADIASLYGSYPLIRSRDRNLTGMLNYEDRSFRDDTEATGSNVSRNAQVLIASAYGDFLDSLGGSASNTYALSLNAGDLRLRSDAATAADQLVGASGRYTKWSFAYARVQALTNAVSLYGAVKGQFASKNLDVSEKMELGGVNNVRAYPEGEAYADQGYVLNVEARWQLPADLGMPGAATLVGFVDTGTVELAKNPWTTATPNRRTLSATGVGVDWRWEDRFIVKAYWAHKLGNAVAMSAPDANSRFWLQLVAQF